MGGTWVVLHCLFRILLDIFQVTPGPPGGARRAEPAAAFSGTNDPLHGMHES